MFQVANASPGFPLLPRHQIVDNFYASLPQYSATDRLWCHHRRQRSAGSERSDLKEGSTRCWLTGVSFPSGRPLERDLIDLAEWRLLLRFFAGWGQCASVAARRLVLSTMIQRFLASTAPFMDGWAEHSAECTRIRLGALEPGPLIIALSIAYVSLARIGRITHFY